MANSQQVATGLSAFVQTFSAIDAVGSRRRQEKKLDERLEDERLFRSQQLEFAQSREDRAQETHEESQEERRLRLEADAVGLDPDSTDEELRAAAVRSPIAVAEIDHRRGLSAFKGLTDAQLEARQAQAAAAGEPDPNSVTAQPSGLSGSDTVGELPSDPRLTREIDLSEIAKQAGVDEPVSDFRRADSVPMPLDWKTEAEINAMPDKREAQALRDRQAAEAKEIMQGDVSGAAQDVKRDRAASERKILDEQWTSIATITDTTGDSNRKLYQDNPSLGTGAYYRQRSSLSKNARDEADVFMAPIAQQSLAEQRAVLDDPELDPTSRDARNAQRKHSRAASVINAISYGKKPAQEVGIRDGLPQGQDELAGQFVSAAEAAPAPATTLPLNKERQLDTQFSRLTANPAKRLSHAQMDNIYTAMKAGLITSVEAHYMATHGGARMPVAGEVFSHSPGQDLMRKFPDGSVQLIAPARDPKLDGVAGRNLMESMGHDMITEYFSSFDTDDDEGRGAKYKFAAMRIMGRVEDVANQNGFDYNNPMDVLRLATRITQTVLIREEFNKQLIMTIDGKPEVNPDFGDHFGEIEKAIFDPSLDVLRAAKEKEIFDDFEGLPLEPLRGNEGDAVARFRQALVSSNDPRRHAIAQGSDEQVLAYMRQEQAAGR